MSDILKRARYKREQDRAVANADAHQRERDLSRFDFEMLDLYPRTLAESEVWLDGVHYPAMRSSGLLYVIYECEGYAHPGYECARRLMSDPGNLYALESLRVRGLLHLSVEALILDKRFRYLFGAFEREEAERRLGPEWSE